MSCHSTTATPHASICPVNAKADCVGCHMPTVDVGPFHLVDHLIRVHSTELETKHVNSSQYPLVSAFLEKLETRAGRETKTYMGRVNIAELSPDFRLLASRLPYGETTESRTTSDTTLAFRRMPRGFEERAALLAASAQVRLGQRDFDGAIAQSAEALTTNPLSLAALVTLGRVLSERGDFSHAAKVLQRATTLHPRDANAAFNFGRVLGRMGQTGQAIEQYRRAIASDSDFVSAYIYLGRALLVTGNVNEAAETLSQGLQVDPLNAALYRAFGDAQKRRGETAASEAAYNTAAKIEGAPKSSALSGVKDLAVR